ncbi:Nif3-like dinuclear metal center hexameric protein [Mesonia maritima]|uniref:GTP cyclohydrolase 1 type 2 homolog n=1 Tax=Mesonia maritima TaxID=1793873 RepID=A0ABU1K9D9_9FLAO|nr:Nif3-like dinuclear metal center hexameric protein [Mesonia maritima]MDR6302219.1 dinuclear metal center YbgI/SA1388 family protein [Mesonia maritima]
MQVREVISALENWAPLQYAEDFDNVGLLVGNRAEEVSGILITLDTLENVVEEAIEKNCNMIVSFHPIIFGGLKKLTGNSYVERVVIKAIQHNIAIYAMHTALDNHHQGVNNMICDQLNLKNRKILVPQENTIKKLVTYIPKKDAEKVREALFEVGAGSIGNYDHCSFNLEGLGSFNPNQESNPTIGKKGETHFEEEVQLNITFPKHLQSKVLQTLQEKHPYEEVAFEVTSLENKNQQIGIGMLGELSKQKEEAEFIKEVKEIFNCGIIRHSQLRDKPIKKVAVLGGSGAFAIGAAKAKKADIYLTADLKYHDFYKAEGKLILADIGHYESEQYTKDLIHSYLTKKFPNFAVVLSQKNTNPIQYS